MIMSIGNFEVNFGYDMLAIYSKYIGLPLSHSGILCLVLMLVFRKKAILFSSVMMPN